MIYWFKKNIELKFDDHNRIDWAINNFLKALFFSKKFFNKYWKLHRTVRRACMVLATNSKLFLLIINWEKTWLIGLIIASQALKIFNYWNRNEIGNWFWFSIELINRVWKKPNQKLLPFLIIILISLSHRINPKYFTNSDINTLHIKKINKNKLAYRITQYLTCIPPSPSSIKYLTQ